MPKPFTRISRETLVDNPWHKYCLDHYTLRDGTEGKYYYVDMPGSCGIIPRFEDGSTALVQVRRYLLDTDLWEFPIGGMAAGEKPLDVAKKELLEEAGLCATDWQKVGVFAPYKGVSNEHCHFYLAEDLTWAEQELENSEEITVHRMPFAEAKQKLLGQALGDGQSLAGLMLYESFISR